MEETSHKLNVTVVGAGLGGLAAAVCLGRQGHRVRVFESASELSELGAGIQIPPNAMRVLDAWGLKDEIENLGTHPNVESLRRFSNGKLVGQQRRNTKDAFGFESIVIHRADLQCLLHQAALRHNVQFFFGARVSYEAIALTSGNTQSDEISTADVIVAADGISSPVRAGLFPGESFKPRLTGDSATRIVLPKEKLLSDEKTADLVRQPTNNVWMGPRRHMVAYTIKNTELYNVVLCGPGEAPVGVYNEPANLEEVQSEYSDFEELVRNVISKADRCHRWMISEIPALPSWTSRDGRIVLLGDAAHAMMPYAAQGAAQCIEDAAALGVCLGKAQSKSDIAKLTKVYQDLRKPRSERIQEVARGNRGLFGLEDGPEQEERDVRLGKSLEHSDSGEQTASAQEKPRPDARAKYGSSEFSEWLYGYDVLGETRRYLEIF